MENLLMELTKFIEDTKEKNKERPYLSEFENGWSEGSNDVVDCLENIIQKYNR